MNLEQAFENWKQDKEQKRVDLYHRRKIMQEYQKLKNQAKSQKDVDYLKDFAKRLQEAEKKYCW